MKVKSKRVLLMEFDGRIIKIVKDKKVIVRFDADAESIDKEFPKKQFNCILGHFGLSSNYNLSINLPIVPQITKYPNLPK